MPTGKIVDVPTLFHFANRKLDRQIILPPQSSKSVDSTGSFCLFFTLNKFYSTQGLRMVNGGFLV